MDTLDTTFDSIPENKSVIAVMDAAGDTKYAWDPKNRAEVDAAREHFAKLKSQGFMIFRVKPFGRKGKPLSEFNPKESRFLAALPPPEKMGKGGPYRVELAKNFDPEERRYMAMAPVAGG